MGKQLASGPPAMAHCDHYVSNHRPAFKRLIMRLSGPIIYVPLCLAIVTN